MQSKKAEVITEGLSILGFKIVNNRQAHERTAAMEEVSAMMTRLRKERIRQWLEVLEARQKNILRQVIGYNIPNVSEKVLQIIVSYTDYKNRVVWGN